MCSHPALYVDVDVDVDVGVDLDLDLDTGSSAMAAGVSAAANRPGVTMLTRSSVHCAESRTAISSVNGSR